VRVGDYYNGDFNSVELLSEYRFSAEMTASIGWTRQDASLPSGDFVTHLVPVKVSYAFTPLASLSALLQHNGQTGQFSSNIRLALLDRSGTGLFIVYNDRRDFTDYTSTSRRKPRGVASAGLGCQPVSGCCRLIWSLRLSRRLLCERHV
jgi:hypothetical protein